MLLAISMNGMITSYLKSRQKQQTEYDMNIFGDNHMKSMLCSRHERPAFYSKLHAEDTSEVERDKSVKLGTLYN